MSCDATTMKSSILANQFIIWVLYLQRYHIAIESLNQIVEDEIMRSHVLRIPVNGRLVGEL